MADMLRSQQRELELYKQKQIAKQETERTNPLIQPMYEEYVKQHPNEDFMGTAFEGAARRVAEKERSQTMPYSPWAGEGGEEDTRKPVGLKGGGKQPSSMASKRAGEKARKEKEVETEQTWSPVVMTPKGPERLFGQKLKDHIMGQIQKKRQMAAADPYEMKGLTEKELEFEKKYLNIKDSSTGPQSDKDWDETLDVAKEIVRSDKISARSAEMQQEGQQSYQIKSEIEMMKKAPITFDEGVGSLAKALKFRYPNMPEEKIAEVTAKYAEENEDRWVPELGLALPPEINNWQKAYQFMIDNGMDEEIAEQRIRDWQMAGEE